MHLLTHGPFRHESNQIFVPFKYKTKKPDLFMHCIRQQNEVYHKTWVIKLEGITPQIMEYIKTDIASIMGVMHVVPTRRLQDIGEWKVLVDQTKCAYIHRQLSSIWKTIINNLPKDVLDAAPSTYSTPSISSKRAREYQDTDSDNDSYGSLLTTGTDISMMTTEDPTLNELPDDYKFPSYAAAAASSSDKFGQETEVSSPTNSTYTGWQKEKQALEDQIKAQAAQIERIQADLLSKISRSKDLEDKLAQALELAQHRDERHMEMLAKFELLMKVHSDGHKAPHHSVQGDEDTSDSPLPTTPDRHQPPPKKANTNSSPQRNIYSLFRQQPGRPTPRNASGPRGTSNRKSAPLLLTQPMDTDEDSRQPTPGAKPGNKEE